jgi:hypothetical protein
MKTLGLGRVLQAKRSTQVNFGGAAVCQWSDGPQAGKDRVGHGSLHAGAHEQGQVRPRFRLESDVSVRFHLPSLQILQRAASERLPPDSETLGTGCLKSKMRLYNTAKTAKRDGVVLSGD